MSRRSRRGNGGAAGSEARGTAPAAARPRLPAEAGRLVATVQNDVTIPWWSGVLAPQDDTLVARGGGKGLRIYDEIERDTHAWAMLTKRKKRLVARGWIVEPASEEPGDAAAAEIVRLALGRLPFDRICEELLDATLKGFAVAEVVWAVEGAAVLPRAVVAHDQRRFVFDADWRPRLLTWGDMRQGVELPERKFVVHRHGAKGNNPYGLGLGTRLFWPVLFKREGVSFWLHFLEKFAGPTVVASTPYGTLSEEARKLLGALSEIRTSSAITVPVGTDVRFLEAARSGSGTYAEFLDYWDRQISICVTGETLTTQVGDSGSRALGDVHADMLEALVDSDADLLGDTLQGSLCRWIVELNLPGAAAPHVRRPRPADLVAKASALEAQARAAAARAAALRQLQELTRPIAEDERARRILVALAEGEPLAEEDWAALARARASRALPRLAVPGAEGDGEADEEGEPAFGAPPHGAPGHVCLAAPDDGVSRLVAAALGAARPLIEARVAAARAAVLNAADRAAAAAALLALAADWRPEALGALLGEALELAALEGREVVLREAEGSEDFAAGEPPVPLPFREQIEFLLQKRPAPSRAWTDFMQGQHDRAFVVAGAADLALVQDFQQAVWRAAESADMRAFGREFDEIVARHGWSFVGGRDWRVRTIFETNLRSSHMAGRLRQMRDPDVVRMRPYWRYVHGETRTPQTPRPRHLAWDGLVLRHDDPWWDTHFPPNDWRCSCGVRTLSEDDLLALGKTGPDEAPPIQWERITDPQTGREARKPKGIGLGWDYMPGDLWTRGVTPRALAETEGAALFGRRHLVEIDRPRPLAEILDAARPFASEMIAPDPEAPLAPEDYARAFLDEFGARIGEPVLFTDAAGQRVPISEALLQDRQGNWKVHKRDRAALVRLLAETIRDPDEIWIGVVARKPGAAPEASRVVVDRRYFRTDGTIGLMAVFEADRWAWEEVTTYPLAKRSGPPDLQGWAARRGGKLIWRRPPPG